MLLEGERLVDRLARDMRPLAMMEIRRWHVSQRAHGTRKLLVRSASLAGGDGALERQPEGARAPARAHKEVFGKGTVAHHFRVDRFTQVTIELQAGEILQPEIPVAIDLRLLQPGM